MTIRSLSLLTATALVGSHLFTSSVRAGGLEYTGAGAQALGRGGAVTAKADDPMVLAYNPAGLVELRGSQLLLDQNIAIMKACVDPAGYYGWGVYDGGRPAQLTDTKTGETLNLNLGDGMPGPADQYYANQLDTVCMSPRPFPIPQLIFTARLSERFGIGAGLVFPAGMTQGQWGGDNGVIRGALGQLRPSPLRYMNIRSGTLGIFPTLGLGYKLASWLRIGAAFEWGIINIDNLSMAGMSGGTGPQGDILTRVRATDWFVPAFNASIHLVPIDAIDIVAAFRWQDELVAAGTNELTTGAFDPNAIPTSSTVNVIGVHQNMPWKARVGVRYAKRLAPRPSGNGYEDLTVRGDGRVHDPFEDELWDIEADLEYQFNAKNQLQYVEYNPMQQLLFKYKSGAMNVQPFPMRPWSGGSLNSEIPKVWKDQYSVRVGGSYNILPGLFGISLGAHYENRGVDPSYMQLDYWPLSRFGIHAGIKFRVSRTIDLVASYAHIFQETLVVGAPPHGMASDIYKQYAKDGTITAIDKHAGQVGVDGSDPPILEEPKPAQVDGTARLSQVAPYATAGTPPYIVNSGTYRSSIDVVAIGANVHF